MNIKDCTRGLAVLLTLMCLGGCAFGVAKVQVRHTPLEPPAVKRSGTVVVRQFVDSREEDHQYIGNKRNGLGMAVGSVAIHDGTPVDELVTELFDEALKNVGYDTVLQESVNGVVPTGPASAAILHGDIKHFWLDLYVAVWHNVDVDLKLTDRSDSRVLWEKKIHGGKSNVLWLGIDSEFEHVVRQGVDEALTNACAEFASEEFSEAVKTGRN